MIRYLKVIFLCYSLLCTVFAIQLPPSPCPNVFAYEGDAEPDRWHGVITFSSNIELVGMNYKVQLDRPSQLLVSWDGEVRTEDNTNYNVFDPFHTQRGGEIVKARIMVKFNPNNGIPGIVRIVINGNTMCSRDGNFGSGFGISLSSVSTTERYDPTFSEGDDIASEFSNNRGQQSSSNYGGNSPNYNENSSGYDTRPNSNRPTYVANEPNYSGSSGPNYNSGSSNSNTNRHVPNYVNSAATSSPVYVVNPSNTAGNSNSGSYVPNSNPNNYNGNGGSGGSYSGQSNYNGNSNPEYSNNGNNRPQQQWSDTSSSNNYNVNRTGTWQSNGFSNSQPPTSSAETNVNNGPIVTTLTLPNGSASNKTNIDQIVQIIKNQLEQQQVSSSSNKTVIVAVVNPMPSHVAQISTNATATTTDSPVVYRTTTPSTTTVSSKSKIVVSTAKSSSSNGHTSRPNKD